MLRYSTSTARAFLKQLDLFLNCVLAVALVTIGILALEPYCVPIWDRGEFGADLRELNRYYTPPQGSGENNHVVDMLKTGSFTEFLRIQGLTNNHALFVLSHGRAITNLPSPESRYAYYPDQRVLSSEVAPNYSARDLAKLLGPTNAEQIHNVILAGCNIEGAFDPAEVRRYFVNATNITHTPAGKNGFEFVFRHGIMHPAEGIKLLYLHADTFSVGDFSEKSSASQRFSKVSPYVAELFRPDGQTPYKTQVASRELLGPMSLVTTQVNSNTCSSTNLSAMLDSAMTALEKSPAPRAAKPFILIGVNRQRSSSTLASELLDPLGGVFKHLRFSFLGIWSSTLLSAVLGLMMLRIACFCLRIVCQLPEIQAEGPISLRSLLSLVAGTRSASLG